MDVSAPTARNMTHATLPDPQNRITGKADVQDAVLHQAADAFETHFLAEMLKSAGNALPRPDLDEGYLTGEIDDRAFDPSRLPIVSMDDGQGPGFGESADPVERLRQMIAERQDETVEILRSWMEDREENA